MSKEMKKGVPKGGSNNNFTFALPKMKTSAAFSANVCV
jgi:hypothetical protein